MHDQLRQDIENQRKELDDRSSKRLRIGWWITGSYAAFLLIMAWFAKTQLLTRSPNEFGDLMAGIFGPLAFLWLVLGYFQQGDEMRQSTLALVAQGIELANNGEALRLQADELKNAVEQHKEMVVATRESLNFNKKVHDLASAAQAKSRHPHFVPITPELLTANASGTVIEWRGGIELRKGSDTIHNLQISSTTAYFRPGSHPRDVVPGTSIAIKIADPSLKPRSMFPRRFRIDLSYIDSSGTAFRQHVIWERGIDGKPALKESDYGPA